MGKFFGWVGGILATVIGGYIIFYITRPTQIEGMVIDRSQNTAVEKALVTVKIKGAPREGPFDDSTDANGSYGMELSGLNWNTTVVVHARAKGFHDSAPVMLVIRPGGNRKDFFLSPIVSSVPPPAPPLGVNPSSHPAMAHPPAFLKKAVVQKFLIQKK